MRTEVFDQLAMLAAGFGAGSILGAMFAIWLSNRVVRIRVR
jgi:hypothetical protein